MIGVDPSMSDTGLAVVDQDDNVLKVQSIKTKAGGADLTRCVYTVDQILEVVDSYIHEHKVRIFVEAIPFSRNPNGKLFTRTEMVGMLKYQLRKRNAEVYFVQSKTLKLTMAKNGAAKKEHMQAAVYKRYGRLVKNDNIADALSAAAIGSDFIYRGVRFPHERLPMD